MPSRVAGCNLIYPASNPCSLPSFSLSRPNDPIKHKLVVRANVSLICQRGKGGRGSWKGAQISCSIVFPLFSTLFVFLFLYLTIKCFCANFNFSAFDLRPLQLLPPLFTLERIVNCLLLYLLVIHFSVKLHMPFPQTQEVPVSLFSPTVLSFSFPHNSICNLLPEKCNRGREGNGNEALDSI